MVPVALLLRQSAQQRHTPADMHQKAYVVGIEGIHKKHHSIYSILPRSQARHHLLKTISHKVCIHAESKSCTFHTHEQSTIALCTYPYETLPLSIVYQASKAELGGVRGRVAVGTFIPAPEGPLLLFDVHPPGGSGPPQGPVAAALHVMAHGLAPPHPAGLHPPQPLLTAACSTHSQEVNGKLALQF